MQAHEFERMHRVEREHFWFVGTRDVILKTLRSSLGEGWRETAVLDVGCGTGYSLSRLADAGHRGLRVGVDFSMDALAFARRQQGAPAVLRADALRLPFADGAFDAVLALDVLEHLDRDADAARELGRVVRPGGLLLVTVPAFQLLWSDHDVNLEHRRRYRRAQIERLLVGAGLQVEYATYYNAFLFPLVMVRRLGGRLASLLVPRAATTPVVTDNALPPRWLNRVLYRALSAEQHLLGRTRFPLGGSILAVGRQR